VWYCSLILYPLADIVEYEHGAQQIDRMAHLIDAANPEAKSASFDASPVHVVANQENELAKDEQLFH